MKTLIVLSAIPASGKSTWAKAYCSSHENVKIVSSDAIRYEITGTYNDHTRQKEVWELFEKRIKEYAQIDNVTVILDALNDLNVLRSKYVKENPEFDKYILVLFSSNEENCQYYNSLRSEDKVPEAILSNLFAKFEDVDEPTADLFEEIYKVNWAESLEVRVK